MAKIESLMVFNVTRRAIIIKSEGEKKAADNLMLAAKKLSASHGGIMLRTLQTISDIAADPSEKIIILLPSEMNGLGETLIKSLKKK